MFNVDIKHLAILLGGVTVSLSAQGQSSTYFNSYASFVAALNGSSLTVSSGWSSADQASFSGNGYSFEVSTYPYQGVGLYVASGVNTSGDPSEGTSGESPLFAGFPLTFNSFSGDVNAFGGYFYPVTYGGNLIPGSVDVSINGGPAFTVSTSSSAGPVPFFGIVDSVPITSVTVTAVITTGAAFPTADYVTVGSTSVVPEPNISALIIGGFAFLFRRRFLADGCSVRI